jgi:two-component sensor histidine kinase
MALIHEKLYKSSDMSSIDFAAYVKSLISGLYSSYVTPANVSLKVEIDDITLGIDTAIPCGLIINELISNSMKYAFCNDCGGEISVSMLQTDDDYLQLTVKDTGIGIPDNVDFINSDTLGFQLVVSLSEEQLHGTISLNRDHGAAFTIKFKELSNYHDSQPPLAQ